MTVEEVKEFVEQAADVIIVHEGTNNLKNFYFWRDSGGSHEKL